MNCDLSLVAGDITASLAPVRHEVTRKPAAASPPDPRGWQTAHGDRSDIPSPPTEPRLRPTLGQNIAARGDGEQKARRGLAEGGRP
jgi:hypothetical protein